MAYTMSQKRTVGAPLMPEEHREKLRAHRMALIQDLEPQEVIQHLYSKMILTDSQVDAIKAIPTRNEQVTRLLDTLMRRGANAYPAFLEALEESHAHLYELLTASNQRNQQDEYYMNGYDVVQSAHISAQADIGDSDECEYAELPDEVDDGYTQMPGMSLQESLSALLHKRRALLDDLRVKKEPEKSACISHQDKSHTVYDISDYEEPVRKKEHKKLVNSEVIDTPTAVITESCEVEELQHKEEILDFDKHYGIDTSKIPLPLPHPISQRPLPPLPLSPEQSREPLSQPCLTSVENDYKNETVGKNSIKDLIATLDTKENEKPLTASSSNSCEDDNKLLSDKTHDHIEREEANTESNNGNVKHDRENTSQNVIEIKPECRPVAEVASPMKTIELKKGELVFVSTADILPDPSFVAVYDTRSRFLKVPKSKLRQHGDPRGQPWYYPLPLSSVQATMILSQINKSGCFLLYTPLVKRPDVAYNLSICLDTGNVTTFHVITQSTYQLYISEGRTFFTISDLINYYKQNRGTLSCRLRRSPAVLDVPFDLASKFRESKIIDPGDINKSDEESESLGQGFFGKVTKGVFRNQRIAMKSLLPESAGDSPWVIDEFYEEAYINSLLDHPNIVRFLGVSSAIEAPCMFHELMSGGDLRTALRNNMYDMKNTEALLDLCIQIVSALRYLRKKNYILHRDIAARNCLLYSTTHVKLSDFGLARQVIEDEYIAEKSERISVRWAAPEVLQSLRFSTASDIWAVGVLFWEIFSGGKVPYEGFKNAQVTHMTVTKECLPQPDTCPDDIYAVMKNCWLWEAGQRPSPGNLIDMLQKQHYFWPAVEENCVAATGELDKPKVKGLKKLNSMFRKGYTRSGRKNK